MSEHAFNAAPTRRDRLTVVHDCGHDAGTVAPVSGPRADPRPQIVEFDRPWGHQEVFTTNEASTVKILTVLPGARLSLQRHEHRDEMWVVLDLGVAAVVGQDRRTYAVGERVWIPRGTQHRLINEGQAPVRVLEVSFGHFDECDIERLEDDFDRA